MYHVIPSTTYSPDKERRANESREQQQKRVAKRSAFKTLEERVRLEKAGVFGPRERLAKAVINDTKRTSKTELITTSE